MAKKTESVLPMRREKKATLNGKKTKSRRAGVAQSTSELVDVSERTLNVRADTIDFRDLMFTPTLAEVPPRVPLESYLAHQVPILNQGREGACTGFGLATVVHYLLKTRRVDPDTIPVSPRMLYDMARRYDEWEGTGYSGSSCRGAMKGWQKHGVSSESAWPYVPGLDPNAPAEPLNDVRARDAVKRPLGAYFRVNHRDIVSMHTAIAEVGIVYVSCGVHEGWNAINQDGYIKPGGKPLGGHAFAIVAYDADGFWFQNSWGDVWGRNGFGHLRYDDWLDNATDAWVARLGAPIRLIETASAISGGFSSAFRSRAPAAHIVRPHIVSLGNDGQFDNSDTYGTSQADIDEIFDNDFPRITSGWSKKRIVLYAHGGLVGVEDAVARVADYLPTMMRNEIYPVAFVWRSDYWSTLSNILKDALQKRRPEGVWDNLKDFMLDRLDDMLEPVARTLTGRKSWEEMKENARLATDSSTGGARYVAGKVKALLANDPSIEIHVVGHSAGSIFHAHLLKHLIEDHRLPVESLTLWAPACRMDLFESHYEPLISSGSIKSFNLYTLTDRAEQDDDCARIYNKSLLYLVSNAFEADRETPILGMAKYVDKNATLKRILLKRSAAWIQSPTTENVHEKDASEASAHGAFDDDKKTLNSTLWRVLGHAPAQTADEQKSSTSNFRRSASSLREQRLRVAAIRSAS
jgi:hypothetical protein